MGENLYYNNYVEPKKSKVMKKINLLSGFHGCIAISLLMFMFFACQKDDTMQPSAQTSSAPIEKTIPVNPTALPYEIIKINHISPRGLVPDYEMTLSTNLTVRFEGRRNTAYQGVKILKTDERTYAMLKYMYESSHLFDVPSASVNNGMADQPVVYTSFNNGTQMITLTDYNTGDPAKLYELRQRTEMMLGITLLVYGE